LLGVALTTRPSASTAVPQELSDRLMVVARLQEAGNHRDAIEILEQIRESDPDNGTVLYGLALSLYAVGEDREAAHIGETLIGEAGEASAPADIYVIVGSAYGRLRLWEKSEQILSKGLAAWPDHEALRIQHAISLEGLGRLDEALVELQGCVKRSPYEASLWRALGDGLSAAGSPGRAFAAYVRSLTLESDEGRAKEVAGSLWSLLFRGASGASAGDASEKAEAQGMALLAALRKDDRWAHQSDAKYFAYALDTSLRLVAALHGRESHDLFWGPFAIDYFDEVRAAGHMEALAYEIRRATGDPDVTRWRAQNNQKVAAFRKWSERWSVKWPGGDGQDDAGR
jgi:tetratricopeptide (TPR) repeat protein